MSILYHIAENFAVRLAASATIYLGRKCKPYSDSAFLHAATRNITFFTTVLFTNVFLKGNILASGRRNHGEVFASIGPHLRAYAMHDHDALTFYRVVPA